MTAEVRRSIVLAIAGLLGGFAMVVALFGTGELLKRNAANGPSSQVPAAPPASRAETGADETAEGEKSSSIPHAALSTPSQGGGTAPAGERAPGAGPPEPSGAPTFDIVRVEPDGASVVAGRAAPNARIELLRDGRVFAGTVADAGGQFALTPPALPPGSSEIVLNAVGTDGKPLRGRESVTVVVSEKRDAKPLIALSAPDAPTRVLSQPDAPEAPAGKPVTAFADTPGRAAPQAAARGTKGTEKSASKEPAGAAKEASRQREAGKLPRESERDRSTPARDPSALRIVSVDAQEGGRLDVTGQASADSTLRLYLNDTLIASGRPGPDGRIAFTIGRGVRPGAYQIRVDSVDPSDGKVRTRAEVAFAYPETPAARVASAAGRAELPAEASGGRKSSADPGRANRETLSRAQPTSAQAEAGRASPTKPVPAPAGPATPLSGTPDARTSTAWTAENQPGRLGPDQGSQAAATTAAARPGGDAKTDAKSDPKSDVKEATGSRPAEIPPGTRPAPSLAGRPPIPAADAAGRDRGAAGAPALAAAGGASIPSAAADGRAAAALAPTLPGAEGTSSPEDRIASAEQAPEPSGNPAGSVYVPEISTARITRGDSLWQISRRTYGKGNRYTVIYDANQEQIRDPDLIYPGQIFVLPKDAPAAADAPTPKRT